jgi:hypothetical protein
VSPRLVGLALGQVLNLSGTMQWAVRQSAEAENNMTSIERLLEYTRLPQARRPWPTLPKFLSSACWSARGCRRRAAHAVHLSQGAQSVLHS